MHSRIVALFEQFDRAMDKQSGADVAALYHLPAVIMNDDEKLVYTDRQELERRITNILGLFQQSGVVHHHGEVAHVMRLSEAIWFCTVDWQLKDEQHNVIEHCMTSHTLQLNGELQIIISVIDENITRLLNVAAQRGST